MAISLDRAAYSIVENEQVVTVNLTLNDTYREDIEVNVTVGELLGGCTRLTVLTVVGSEAVTGVIVSRCTGT